MIENNRNNKQIYGRNDMIMLDQNNKIYGSLGIADKYVLKTEEGTMLVLKNPKSGKFGDVLTEFNMYGKSEQKQYKGINLFPPDTKLGEYAEVSIPKGSLVFWITDRTPTRGGNFRFFNEDKTESMWFGVDSGATSKRTTLTVDAKYVQNLIDTDTDFDASKMCLGVGSEPIYEPYTGGIPSPSPDYPQEIKSAVNPIVKVRGANLLKLSFKEKSNNGVTVDVVENKIRFHGTIRDTYAYWRLDNPVVIKKGTKVSLYVDDFNNHGAFVWLKKVSDNSSLLVLNKREPDVTLKNDFQLTTIGIEQYTVGDTIDFTTTFAVLCNTNQYETYHEQSITLPYTLNAIPVASGGNVTINSQQYIADYVDVERGKLVKKLKRFTISDVKAVSTWGVNKNADNITGFYFYTSENGLPKTNNDVMASTILQYADSTWGGKNVGCAMSSSYDNNYAILSVPTNILEDISSDENACASLVKICENTNAIFFYSMASPIETNLTPEEIEQYKKLRTKVPTTIVENNYNTWMKATYKSIESV